MSSRGFVRFDGGCRVPLIVRVTADCDANRMAVGHTMNRQVVAGLFVTAGLIAGIVPAAPASATAAGESTTFEQFDGSSAPLAIEKGPDGAMWFTEGIASRITSVATRRGTTVALTFAPALNQLGAQAKPSPIVGTSTRR